MASANTLTRNSGRPPWRLGASLLAAGVDAGAVALLIARGATAAACGLALALHIAATALLLLARDLPGYRRGLLLAFGFAVPVVGAGAAMLSLARGRPSELELGMAEEQERAAAPDARQIHEVGEALAAPEALLAASAEQRRAMLWALGRRADAESIALLRWALTAASTELGLEAALALEDVSSAFDKRLDAARRALREEPSGASALAVVACITSGCETGILDVALMGVLADEARSACAVALQHAGDEGSEVALARARLELAVMRPDSALDVIDGAIGIAAPPWQGELRRLRVEAALRANDLPWEGASALLTYRRPVPPRTTTRHREDSRRAGVRQTA